MKRLEDDTIRLETIGSLREGKRHFMSARDLSNLSEHYRVTSMLEMLNGMWGTDHKDLIDFCVSPEELITQSNVLVEHLSAAIEKEQMT